MARFHICIVLIAAGAFCMAAGRVGSASGEDFRVENTVYAGDQKEPSSREHDDLLPRRGLRLHEDARRDRGVRQGGRPVRAVELPHRTRTELTTAELAAFIDRLQTLAAKSKDPLVRFLAEPKFEERFRTRPAS